MDERSEHCGASEGVSVASEQSERTSSWPNTNVSISRGSESLCMEELIQTRINPIIDMQSKSNHGDVRQLIFVYQFYLMHVLRTRDAGVFCSLERRRLPWREKSWRYCVDVAEKQKAKQLPV